MSDNKTQPQQPKIDEIEVNYVSIPADDAMKAVNRIVADKTRTPKFMIEEAQKVVGPAIETIQQRTAETMKGLTDKAASLRGKMRLSIAPAPEQAVALQYTLQALQARWIEMKREDMMDDWEEALNAGDLITARVYRDFAKRELERKIRRDNREKPVTGAVISTRLNELVARTNEQMLTPEQKKARTELANVEATPAAVTKASNKALHQVRNIGINAKGEVFNKFDEQHRRLVRSML